MEVEEQVVSSATSLELDVTDKKEVELNNTTLPLIEKNDESFRCSVCIEIFTDPRTLQCGHTFCLICLTSCRTAHCPLCRYYYKDVKSVSQNITLCEIITVARQSGMLNTDKETPKCAFFHECKQHTHIYCENCEVFICNECQSKHSESPFSKHHFPLIDTSKQKIRSKCLQHRNYIDLFCQTCDAAVCTTCCLLSHKSHNFCSISSASQVQQGKIRLIARELANKKASILSKSKSHTTKITKMEKKIEVIQKAIDKRKNDANKLIDTLASLDQQIDSVNRLVNEWEFVDHTKFKTTITQISKQFDLRLNHGKLLSAQYSSTVTVDDSSSSSDSTTSSSSEQSTDVMQESSSSTSSSSSSEQQIRLIRQPPNVTRFASSSDDSSSD